MAAIKHILFPYDFSRQGELAIPFVRTIASRYGATVTVFGVVPPVWNTATADVPVLVREETEGQERALESQLDRALEQDFAGFTVERATALGDPALRIVEFAHSHKVDLIAMPTHGFGVFRSLLIGSVTAKVLHDAHCPVWTATHAEEQHAQALPRSIVCAVDGTSEDTVMLMHWASCFSKAMGASLKLFHAVPPISDWLALPSERELQEQVRTEARAKLDAQLQQAAGIDAPLRVAVGKITDAVAEEARQENADLLIIGRGTAHEKLGRLRSHTYGIIQQSPCPVLSV